ncbi:MAG TPA: SMP-30/gluconolactonase/LRE family protein [Gemmatales bacterium]|nr:SMP-30/gluconolactonase/LRE family protein [Gemmatales bacterium]HMP59822.1 SMP-30/gluconolactonase/LRE family protein [Gemmatales bacterium]
MRRRLLLTATVLIALGGAASHAWTAAADEIAPTGEIVKVQTGFSFTEGPAADKEGNIYFTDIPKNRIMRLSRSGELSVFLEESQRCNGLMMDPRGRLVACQGGAGRVIAIDTETKEITVLADRYQGKRFKAPNDLTIDQQGGIYFTDPSFGAGPDAQETEAVYYVSPGGEVTRLIADLKQPNGIHLSRDEKTLYVLPSGTTGLFAYPIEAPGKLGSPQKHEVVKHGGDGMAMDVDGNLYLTQMMLSGVLVVSPEGKQLGLIKLPEVPANCVFGGPDFQTLYVTARTSVYAVPMPRKGWHYLFSKS